MKKVLGLLAVVVVTASLYVGCLSEDPYTVALPDIVEVKPPGTSIMVDPTDTLQPRDKRPIVPIPPLPDPDPDPTQCTTPPCGDTDPTAPDPPATAVVIPPVKPPLPVYSDNYWVTGDLEDMTPIFIPPSPYVPPSVIPDNIRETFEKDMPIFSGVTPPDISGQYVANRFTLVASSLSYDRIGGTNWYDQYIAFIRGSDGKISYKAREGTDSKYSSEEVAIDVVGSNNNFTAYFVLSGTSRGIQVKESVIISGTWTSDGIRDFKYAFIMLEKGPDPSGLLVPVNTYRTFKDGDGLASKYNWLSKKAQSPELGRQGLLEATRQ